VLAAPFDDAGRYFPWLITLFKLLKFDRHCLDVLEQAGSHAATDCHESDLQNQRSEGF
jgi:hypothetical protein